MNTVQDYIKSDYLEWLDENGFKYKQARIKTDKGSLEILYNDNFCVKIYDRLGHGFGVTINVANKYDESIYDNDKFSLHWVFAYFGISQTASFSSRTESQYQQNIQNLITDIKIILPRLGELNSKEWDIMEKWISNKSRDEVNLVIVLRCI